MNKTKLGMMAFVAMATVACTNGNDKMNSGMRTENFDLTAKPGDDFYQYACGGWIKNNPLTDEYSRYGTFEQLDQTCREQLKTLITDIASSEHEKGSVSQKVGDLYNMAMDVEKRNQLGNEPILPLLQKIGAMKTSDEVMPMVADLYMKGMRSFFITYVAADMMDSKANLVQINQGGLAMGEKGYYLDEDEATVAVREAYRQHVVKMFELAGFDKADAQHSMEAVMRIETAIAKASKSAVELRDVEGNYHKMSVEELKKQYDLDWDAYFEALGMKGVAELSVSQLEPIQEVARIIREEPMSDIIAYMQWTVLDANATFLSEDFEKQNFDFYGRTMSGQQEQKPLWKRGVDVVDGLLGEAVGQMYVEKYFPAAAKERMVKLVHNLQIALGERIDAQGWMSDETKKRAHEKLDAFIVKVGYPDKWMDYSLLDIDASLSLPVNVMRASQFAWNDMVTRKYGQPVDFSEWQMTPQTVNAYYNPTTNEICFPAGILQYPFFDMNADDAFNYGAIGVVIGHEMTHGFDDQGRQFDKDGNFADWWTAQDAEQFTARVQVLVDHFNKIEVLPGLHANGALTLGENIADHGGLMVAYQALQNATKNAPLGEKDGFTANQRFFLANATVWAASIRDEEIRKRTKSDPHSLGCWRVNGTYPHIDAWYEAFGITEKDALYLPKEERADIW